MQEEISYQAQSFPGWPQDALFGPQGTPNSLPPPPKKTGVNTGYQFLLHPIEIYKNSGVLLPLGACGCFVRLMI